MSKVICGIDPGKDGGICLINEDDYSIIDIQKMPTIVAGNKFKKKKEFDIPEIVNLIKRADVIAIEKVNAMPEQGVVSMFNFGAGWGILIGISAGLGKPYTLIHPRTWKSNIMRDMGKDKGSSVLRAKQLCPTINLFPTERSRVPHNGMAEAYLIARFHRQQIEVF